MSLEVSSVDEDAVFDYSNWVLETGIWNGRPIKWKEASDFHTELQQRIEHLFFSQTPSSLAFQKLAVGQAWIEKQAHLKELLNFKKEMPKDSIVSSCSPTASDKSLVRRFFETIGRGEFEVEPSTIRNEISRSFITPGSRQSSCRIGGINGINISLDDAIGHASYLSSFTPNHSVEWVYNHSNGPLTDLAEIISLNYLGQSPNTGKLLRENWLEFHEQNMGNPHAKYLQFCHSQGTIHVRNELVKLPKEIRDRIIVVAIAPAAIVPRELCYDSFNYASKKDIVHVGEVIFAGAMDSKEYGTSKFVEMVYETREQLILLEPHPDATDIDHGLQSPTFKKQIEYHIKFHLESKGEYR